MNKEVVPVMPKEMQDALQEKIRGFHHPLSFKCGAVEAFEYMASEIEALKGQKEILLKKYTELFEATQRLVNATEEGASTIAWIDVNEIIDQTPQCS